MSDPIDWTKPIQFANGEPCELLSIHPEGSPNFPEYTHVIRRTGKNVSIYESIWWVNADGKTCWGDEFSIINKALEESK